MINSAPEADILQNVPEASPRLENVRTAIRELPDQLVGYSSQTSRQKRKKLVQRKIFRELLVKLAGSNVDDQITFLVDQAKTISKRTYVHVTLASMDVAPDFGTMTRDSRKYWRHIHKLVDKILPLAAGSATPNSQIKLLKVRWAVLHDNMTIPADYTWKTLSSAVATLPEPIPYKQLTQKQKIHSQHSTKIKTLDILLTKLTGSNRLEDHIILIADRLKHIHKMNPAKARFLSLNHLGLFADYLIPLTKFTTPKPEFQAQYDTIKVLAEKLAGTNDPETICRFLRTQFPQLITWDTVFEQTEVLEASPERPDFPEKMKALLKKFAGDSLIEFLLTNFEVFASTLSSPLLQDLMSINNHIVSLRRRKESNEHLKNFRKCILSCLTRPFNFSELIEAGWDISFWFWKACEENRDDEKSFYDFDPASNAGKKRISEALANEIGQL